MIILSFRNFSESSNSIFNLYKFSFNTCELFCNEERLRKEFPAIPIKMVDERFTSKMASQAMIDMGLKKKQRQNKALVDEIAATIMLQEYLRCIS